MEQIEFIENFIKQIDNTLKFKNQDTAKKLQSKVIAAFKNDIANLDEDLSYDMPDLNSDTYIYRADYIDNLELLKCKLESYLVKLKSKNNISVSDRRNETILNINNTNNNTNTNHNNMDMKVVFDEARKLVEENESLEEQQIEEIKDKITELESIFNSEDSKKNKWNKCREILSWVVTKGVSIASIVVPLIAKCLKNNHV